MTVNRAVILAAGYGTRMLPATKALPKESMPLVDTPIIEYIVEEAVESGIRHIVIVTSAGKRAVEDHFGRVHDLEQLLEAKGDEERLRRIRRTAHLADVVFVRQHHMGGIADAVRTARPAIGNEPFVLMLPDDVIVAEPAATLQLIRVFERFGASAVALERIPAEDTSRYGVIRPQSVEPGIYKVQALVEKPAPADAPSDLAIIGRYVFTPAIFEAIERTEPGAGGELQITDAMAKLIEREDLFGCELQGSRYDTGQPLGYLRANIELALRRPEFGVALRQYLKELVQSDLFRAET